ncbi:MAG TPA: CHASE3 domain-containing protein, partial [Steroidobacteraceae bacterium]
VETADGEDPHSAPDRKLELTERKVRLGFASALVCLALVSFISYLSTARLSASSGWVEHTQEVLQRLESLMEAATDAESAQRGYVITGDANYLEPFRESAQAIDLQAGQVRRLTADNPLQQQRLSTVVTLVTERLDYLRTVIGLRRDQGLEAARNEILTGNGNGFHDQLRRQIDEMKATESSLLSERERSAQRSSALALAIIIVGGLLALLIVGAALLAIRRDFAGRMRAERALRDMNDQLELRVQERAAQLSQLAAIIESSDDAILSTDLTGHITSWNRGAQRLFGYTTDEALGQSKSMLTPPERADEEFAILERIARGESTDHFETVRLAKDGRKIDVSVSISPVRDRQGVLVGASKISRDISDRKLAEGKLQAQLARLSLLQQITRAIGERQDMRSIFQVVVRTLEEHLPLDFCCICTYDPADNVLIVISVGVKSQALAMELALTQQSRVEIDADGLAHSVHGRLVYEPDISRVASPFPQRLGKGGLRSMVAAPLLVESKIFGVVIAARTQANSFSSGECEFLKQASEHVALAAHQAQLYGALQQAYDDLRRTQKAVMQQERLMALGQMASGIAHDINNAISPVSLYTESLLEDTDLSERARGQLETIRRAIDDVAQTVSRMREFYRQREPQLEMAALDLNRLVQQVVDLTRARWSDMAQRRGIVIEMRTELAPDLPTVMGADNEIREALTNLIFNAIDAMPNGGPLIVRTSSAHEQGSYSHGSPTRDFARVEIVDHGVGMDEDTRRRCLEPFFTTKGERGTGLGLAMVYGTMQRHGADIEIESELGKGTTMRLVFPAQTAPAVAALPASAPGEVPPQRILIVDDDPLVLKSLRDALEADGHDLTTADGGQAGIDAFVAARSRGDPFPVVITDLGMPYVDGRKVSSAVKTLAPSTIVLLLTGWGQRLMADGDIPAHVDRVLGKPPKLRELREALAGCLTNRASAA